MPKQPPKLSSVADELPPEGAEHLWRWFNEIVMGLEDNEFGVSLIGWTSLRSWSLLAGIALEPWEAKALVRLGIVRAALLNKTD